MLDTIEAAELYSLLCGSEEIALIDLRERGAYGARHILRAVNVPLSRFELAFRERLQRQTVQIVLMDDGAGLAQRAAGILTFARWHNVKIFEGGLDAWEAAGYPLFSGVNVPSKAFGEHVEAQYGTPHITASDLAARQAAGEDIAILDSRPFDAFHTLSIPGAINVPGAELVHRVRAAVPNPDQPIVVNCAGRTRSIIGAQSLINARVPNPVMALENGTMGWMLAGFQCATSATSVAPAPDPDSSAWAMDAAAVVGKKFGVQEIDPATLSAWRQDEDRTTYLFDVRTIEEFEAGHIPGSIHAPGGQLVQATDDYVGVLNARLILIDDTGTRARMTGSWLKQMGWPDVAVLEGGIADLGTETGKGVAHIPELHTMPVGWLNVEALKSLESPPIVDFSTSLEHRAGHPKGARFAIRARACSDLGSLLSSRIVVFTARDPRMAEMAAQDLTRAGFHRIKVLVGGTDAWEAAGGEMETGLRDPYSKEDDVFHTPYDLGLDKAAMQRYIDWEVALLPQIKADGTLVFPDVEL